VSQGDSWEERYLSVVPEKLTAEDGRVLIQLMCEDPERLAKALQVFAAEAAVPGDE
jgi:hypothetical protein